MNDPARQGHAAGSHPGDTIPAAFKVTESTVTTKGVIIVNYERAGEVKLDGVQVK